MTLRIPRIVAIGLAGLSSVASAKEPRTAMDLDPVRYRADLHVNPGLMIVAAPGLGLGGRFGPADARWMLGTTFQAGRLPRASREAFFDATFDLAEAEVDWDFAVSIDAFLNVVETRYVEGFLGLGYGYETWDVRWDTDVVRVHNAFVNASAGGRVVGGRRAPVFAEVSVSAIYLFGQRDRYPLGSESVSLARFAVNPGIRVGVRFGRRPATADDAPADDAPGST